MLKKIISLLIQVIIFILLLFCLVENKLVIYGISQAHGQITIISNAQSVDEILNDTSFPDSLKQKLIYIKEIKKFVIDSIGLNKTQNYSTVYNQHNLPVLWAVTACEPYSLNAKEWTFPFLGTVSYKGFFNKKDVRKEIAELKRAGYDVDVYCPSGWSTLGWFNDPILSNMLKQNVGSLANLIIHELTHTSLFVKNNVTFNENFANFIGDKGTEMFLETKFGKNSKQLIEYEQRKSDENIFNNYILKNVERLDSIYKSMSPSDSEKIKKEKKRKIITEIVVGVYHLPLNKKKNYFNYSLGAFSEGNAFFMSFKRYDSQSEIFEKEFRVKFKSNLRAYFLWVKQNQENLCK